MKKINIFFNNINFKNYLHFFWCLILIISIFKNAFIWNYGLSGNLFIYQFPLLNFFKNIPQIFYIRAISLSIISIFFLFTKNKKLICVPFFFNGFFNIFLQLSDYLSLHHDMLLSGIIFPLYGCYLLFGNKKKIIYLFVAVTASTYLVSGLNKIDVDFLSGEIVTRIIQRSSFLDFDFITENSTLLAWYAMLLELFTPFILILTSGLYIVTYILLTFPFHLGIAVTGTGTVYNLIYPASFILIIYYSEIEVFKKKPLLFMMYKIILILFILFSLAYIFKIFIYVIKNYVNYV